LLRHKDKMEGIVKDWKIDIISGLLLLDIVALMVIIIFGLQILFNPDRVINSISKLAIYINTAHPLLVQLAFHANKVA